MLSFMFFFQNGPRIHAMAAYRTTNGADDMDVAKMLADLRQEREAIEEAIMTLERLARGRGKRRGRPPAWLAEVKKRGRPAGSKNKGPSAAKAAATN
jgi:DNA invertase Pin-like site-specific DNA recombinase